MSENVWPQMEKEAFVEGNKKAQALIELKKEGEEVKKEREESRKDLQEYQRNLKRVDIFLIGVVVVFSLTFITTISLVFFDLIKSKDIHLQNNILYQNYSNKNNNLKDIINE